MSHYEGLVRKTSSMYCHVFREDFEDFAQTLRVKVCEALKSYDGSRSQMTEEAFVFSCVRNRVKDYLRKLQVRTAAGWEEPVLIEDIAPANNGHDEGPRDAFEFRHYSTNEDQAFADLLAEVPLIPSTLTGQEEKVVALLYVGFNQVDVARQLGITRSESIAAVKRIQVKFADWNPGEMEPPAICCGLAQR